MISSDFRKIAREKLSGKWGTAVCMILAYMLVFFVIGLVQGLFSESSFVSFVISIGIYAIEIPLVFGLSFAFFKLFYGEEVKPFTFWTVGLDNFGRSWGVTFRMFLKLLLPIGLMIVSYLFIGVSISMYATSIISGSSAGSGFFAIIGFILLIVSAIWSALKSLYYSLAQCVAFDNPNLTPKECVEKSKELMTNRRAKLFWLELSFIGWAILSVFTLYIGLLWLIPYMQMATIAFYDHVAHKKETEIINEI